MEVSTLVNRSEEDTCVNQDAESWSKLEPGICDMILEKLPFLERLRLRVVCKEWNCSALKRVEPKPYFVTILRSITSFTKQLVLYDVVSKTLRFKPLPFIFQFTRHRFHLVSFEEHGLIFTDEPMAIFDSELLSDDRLVEMGGEIRWCVYNIHTRTTYLIPKPRATRARVRGHFIGMMVDSSIKPHTFKLVASYDLGHEMQIYDSATRSWGSHPKSNPKSNSPWLLAYGYCAWYFCMCHKGCMYMCTEKAVDGVLVYSMEEDQWKKLSGSPFRGEKRTYLGAWDDRIFAVLHDAGAKSVTVWELMDATQQEWVEYACCSKAQYQHLIEHDGVMNRYCHSEIVSVFSEEYVFMYNWHGCRSYTLVLNLKTKESMGMSS